jgi:CRP-like cAMP-binding protein
MSDQSHVKTLEQLDLLTPLSPELRQSLAELLARAGDVTELPSGTVLYSEGSEADGTGAVLLSGSVSVERAGETPLRVSAPALLGEMYQFNPAATRTATVTADAPGRILEFAWGRFHQMARAALTPADQARFVQAVEEYAFDRLPETPLAQLPGSERLSRRSLLRMSLALFWMADRQTRVDGEILFAAGAPTRGEGLLVLEGKVATIHSGRPLEVLRAPVLLGAVAKAGESPDWKRSVRVMGSAVVLRFQWPAFIAHLADVLPRESLEECLAMLSRAVETRC